MFADTDGSHEFHMHSDDKEFLKQEAKKYIKDGYFVFIEDMDTHELIEIKR